MWAWLSSHAVITCLESARQHDGKQYGGMVHSWQGTLAVRLRVACLSLPALPCTLLLRLARTLVQFRRMHAHPA